MIPIERLEALALRLVALGAGTHPVTGDPDVEEGVVTFAADSLGTVEVLLRKNAAIVATFRFEIARPVQPGSPPRGPRARPERRAAGRTAAHAEKATLEDLRRSADANPEDFASWLRLGHACLVAHRDLEAANALQRAAALNPRHEFVRYLLGLAFSRLGRISEAERWFHSIVSADPQLASANSHLGVAAILNLSEARIELNRPLEALQSLQPAAGLAMEILLRLAKTSMNAGDHAGAIKTFEFLAKSAPANVEILHGLGRSLLWIGRSAEAAPWLFQAVKVAPHEVDLWYDLGLAWSRQRRIPEARRAFRRVLRLDPKHAWAWYDLGCMDALDGKTSAAFQKLRQAVKLGLNRAAHASVDPDLESMRRDKRWPELIESMQNARGVPPEF